MIAGLLLSMLLPVVGPSAGDPAAGRLAQFSSAGRVVATVTSLEGAVRLPGVEVELREWPNATVLATTVTDAVGQVAFPDVPGGRYTVAATRSGLRRANRQYSTFAQTRSSKS